MVGFDFEIIFAQSNVSDLKFCLEKVYNLGDKLIRQKIQAVKMTCHHWPDYSVYPGRQRRDVLSPNFFPLSYTMNSASACIPEQKAVKNIKKLNYPNILLNINQSKPISDLEWRRAIKANVVNFFCCQLNIFLLLFWWIWWQ